MKKEKAFTLVELLVVIAIIALLMSILVPALRKARDQAYRSACANHIKTIVFGMMLYADDYRNLLPAAQSSGPDDPPYAEGYWPWDMRRTTSYKLLKYMGVDRSVYNLAPGEDIPVQNIFFCPGNTQQKRFRETNWTYSAGYRVLGYFFLWAASWNDTGGRAILGPGGQTDITKKWVKRIDIEQPANAELVTDATMSNDDDTTFLKIMCGGNPGGYGSPDSTSHIYSEKKPAGGNIGFVDGHIDWRNFTDMFIRFRYGCPHFWW